MDDLVRIDRKTMAAEVRRSCDPAGNRAPPRGLWPSAADDCQSSSSGAGMISAARLAANRANAQKSTGPKTAAGKLRAARNAQKSTGPTSAAGKMRSAQNARRHGLTLSALREPAFAPAVAELGHAIAGAGSGSQVIALAMRIAAAQIDLMRARCARLDLLAAEPFDNIPRLAAIDRYERLARTQRKHAIRAFYAAARSPAPGTQGTQTELPERTEPKPAAHSGFVKTK
jgi:hypothetical protein